MGRDSQNWDLQEQYLIICVFILLFYRVVSFVTVYISLPRYSYSKSVKQSTENDDIDLLTNDDNNIELGDPSNNGTNRNSISLNRKASTDIINQQQKRSCLSYCWLQFFLDGGYIMELAPWLWNWEQTKIILPEFAWFSKV